MQRKRLKKIGRELIRKEINGFANFEYDFYTQRRGFGKDIHCTEAIVK